MPKQMKGGSFSVRAGKPGTAVRKVKAQGCFRLSTQGISAHGHPKQINAVESRDRREG